MDTRHKACARVRGMMLRAFLKPDRNMKPADLFSLHDVQTIMPPFTWKALP